MAQENGRSFRVNTRFLLLSLLVVILAVPLVFWLHRERKARNLQAVFADAGAAEAKGDWRETVRLLRHYVQFHPEDLKAQERLAAAMEKNAATPADRQAALGVYHSILERDPNRHDLRLKLAELELLARQPDRALKDLAIVLAAEPENATGLLLQAQAQDAWK